MFWHGVWLRWRSGPPPRPDPKLPTTPACGRPTDATGGTWGGCVYDADAIAEKLTGK
jgi:hypothetical protein